MFSQTVTYKCGFCRMSTDNDPTAATTCQDYHWEMHAASPGNSIKIDAEHMNCSSSTDAYLNTAHLTKKTTTLQNKRTILKGRGLRLSLQEDKGTKKHLQINGHSKGSHTCMIDYSKRLYRTKEQMNMLATT